MIKQLIEPTFLMIMAFEMDIDWLQIGGAIGVLLTVLNQLYVIINRIRKNHNGKFFSWISSYNLFNKKNVE